MAASGACNVDVVGFWIDVDENWLGLSERDDFSAVATKVKLGTKDSVTGTDAGGIKQKQQSVSAIGACDATETPI